MRTPLRTLAASAAVLGLTLTACGTEPAERTAASQGAAVTAADEAVAEFAQVDPNLVAGLLPTVYSDESRNVRAEVPVVTTARQMTSAMEVLRERGLREAAWAKATKVDIGYRVVASGPGTLGIVVTPTWSTEAGDISRPSMVWYDAATKRVFSSPALIQESAWGAFTEQVAAAAGRKVDKEKLSAALAADAAPQGDGPMLGFDPDGNLVAQFAPGVLDKKKMVAVTVRAGDVQPLLSEFGKRAESASHSPTAFDGTPPPGVLPEPEPTTDGASTPAPTPAATPADATTPQRPSTAVGPDCTRLKCVALTYDDGPGTETPKLLAALIEAKAPATFFQLGQMVQANPTIAKQVASDGNEVGSHSFSHPNLSQMGAARLQKEIVENAAVLEEAYGRKPMIFRPPYGAHNKTVDEVIRSTGAAIIQWDVDTSDWRTRNAAATENAVVNGKGLQQGSVVLMHDIHPSTVAAAPKILAGLQQKDVTLVTVSELSLNSSPGYQAGRAYCNITSRAQNGFDCRG